MIFQIASAVAAAISHRPLEIGLSKACPLDQRAGVFGRFDIAW
jgi:hypothetical protein